jgi:YVTN family beta-propeller protein
VAALLAAATSTIAGVIQQVGASGGTVSSFVPIAPCRLADTRPEPGVNVGTRATPLGAQETHTFTVWGTNGNCTIPTTATGITANVTSVNPTAAGFLTLWPADVTQPLTSNLNYVAGSPPTPNSVTVRLSANGQLNTFNSAGTVHVIIDIVGYFVASAGGAAGPTGPTGPAGATGPAGPPGPAGPSGALAANIAQLRWDRLRGATIPVGTDPHGVAFDGTNIWVTHSGNKVSKINPTTNTVSATVTVGVGGPGVAFDGTNIWVTNNFSGTVSKIDPTTNTVTATVTVGSNPNGVAFDGTNIWVTRLTSPGTVVKIDPTTDTVTATVTVGFDPRGGVAFDGTNIWVTHSIGGTVWKINPTTNTVTPVRVEVGTIPRGVAFDGTNIWVTNPGSGTVTKLAAYT